MSENTTHPPGATVAVQETLNLAGCMRLCSENIGKEVGLPTSASEYLRLGAEQIERLLTASPPAPAGASEAEKNLFYPPEVLATDPAPHIGLEGREAAEASIRAEKVRHALNGCDAWNESLIVGTVSGERSLLHIAKTLAAEVRRLQALPTTAPSGGEAAEVDALIHDNRNLLNSLNGEAEEVERLRKALTDIAQGDLGEGYPHRDENGRPTNRDQGGWGYISENYDDCFEAGVAAGEWDAAQIAKAALALPAPAPDGRVGEVVERAEVVQRRGLSVVVLHGCGIASFARRQDAENYRDGVNHGLYAGLAPSSEERR
ncbi:hypothetical protein [Roseomonas xinghualingensis]|uniref:hypothetical protein n=1 Tax=Roseomonas xinghualingensis TaxID=2986475 RepID=UPI0021F1F34E|nr:hypothetical protein [Roseomonas sp. SXEYE001]MCV4207536.1 hypothetical protein [Roseomonas sp. SXEYE001]